jgi:hypothetical protein
MSLTDRLANYLSYKGISAYLFEKTCDLGNGYLGKQYKSQGSVGSDILEKVALHYPDLDMNWLISGKGKMLMKPLSGGKKGVVEDGILMREQAAAYKIRSQLIQELKEQVKMLESSMPKGLGKKK